VIRVREKIPQRPAEFDDVKNQAIVDMKNEKRRAVLNEKVEAIRSALGAGASFDSLAAPYGGLKESGFGKEGPRYAIEEMTELKMVVFHLPA